MAERTVAIRVKGDVSDFQRAMMSAKASIKGVRDEIDTTNDRTAWLAQGFLALAPAIAPLGAAAVPMLAGVTTQLFLTGAAAGTMLLAFNGVGDALDALNTYQLEPTTANLEKLQEAMAQLSPAARDFARYLQGLRPVLDDLQASAASGMFPGFEQGIDHLTTRLPLVEQIIHRISKELGDLAAEAGAGLASEKWDDFFTYLDRVAAPLLSDMGHTLGNFATGLANVFVALDPATQDWSKGLLAFSKTFEEATANLDQSEGFQSFLDYVDRMGPEVADLLAAISNALIQLVEAAAPIGPHLIDGLTAFANVIAAIADTPLGTVFIGLGAAVGIYGRAAALAKITTGGLGGVLLAQTKNALRAEVSFRDLGNAALWAGRSTRQMQAELAYATKAGNVTLAAQQTRALAARGAVKEYGKAVGGAAAQGALLAVSMSGVADKVGLSNAATGALIGTIGGPWGIAAGAAAGAALDYAAANNDLEAAIRGVDDAAKTFNSELLGTRLDTLNQQAEDTEETATRWHDILSAIPVAGAYLSVGSDKHFDSAQKAADASKKEGEEALKTAEAQDVLQRSLDLTAKANREVAASIHASVSAMEEQRKEALAAFDAVTQYAQAISDARAQADKSNAGIKVTTKLTAEQRAEVIANRGALSQLAAAWNNQDDTVRNNMKAYDRARGQFVDLAEAMGVGRDQAVKLANSLLEVPNSVATKYAFYSGSARDQIAAIDRQIRSVPKEWRTRFYVTQVNAVNKHGALDNAGVGHADGGTVAGQRLPYRDKVLTYLAPGEEVISNRYGQADRFRRDRASGRIPGYADGGTVSGGRDGGTYESIDLRAAGLMELLAYLRDINHQLSATKSSLKDEEHRRDQLNKRLDDEIDSLRNLRQARSSLISAISGNLSVDPYAAVEATSNPWTGGATDARAASYGEIIDRVQSGKTQANNFAENEEFLAKYLSGKVLSSVLSQGADVVAQFAGFTPAQLRNYQRQYAALLRAQNTASSAGGDLVYQQDISDQSEVVSRWRDRVKDSEKKIRQLERAIKVLEKAQDAADSRRDDIKSKQKKRRSEQHETDLSSASGKRISVDVHDKSTAAETRALRREIVALGKVIAGSQRQSATTIVKGVGDAITKGNRAGVRRAR